MNRSSIEVLSPAGDLEKLKTVIAYGADAVYMSGKEFGLRTFSDNFSHEEMIEGISYAHEHNVKCYVTMNIMAHEDDIEKIDDEILFVANVAKADAVIVSDPGVFRRVRQLVPNLEIHISTQANVTNRMGCNFWADQGASRIVLAREVSLEQLRQIKPKLNPKLTIECFIHGAMCVSYSGRCLLSSYFTGRSANKGSCAQPCRWGYYVVEEKRLEDTLPIEQDQRGTYIFNSKDICMIDHVPEMIESGVDSFKIEGRIKGAYYAAAATKVYREAVDKYFSGEKYEVDSRWKDILDKVVHRDYSTGFFFDNPGQDAKIVYDKSYNKPAFVVGVIDGYDASTGLHKVSQRNKLFVGDTVNVLTPKGYCEPLKAVSLYNEDMEVIDSTPHAQMTYYVKFDRDVELSKMTFISRDGDKDAGIAPSTRA